MQVVGWRVFYADGQMFTSDVSPYDLPLDGLQAVVLYLDEEWAPGRPYRNVLWGGDYLTWDGHVWRSAMDPPHCPTCRVFPGSYLSDEAFAALQHRALAAETL